MPGDDKAGMSAGPGAGRGREPQRPSALVMDGREGLLQGGCGFGSGWEGSVCRPPCPGRDKEDSYPDGGQEL